MEGGIESTPFRLLWWNVCFYAWSCCHFSFLWVFLQKKVVSFVFFLFFFFLVVLCYCDIWRNWTSLTPSTFLFCEHYARRLLCMQKWKAHVDFPPSFDFVGFLLTQKKILFWKQGCKWATFYHTVKQQLWYNRLQIL